MSETGKKDIPDPVHPDYRRGVPVDSTGKVPRFVKPNPTDDRRAILKEAEACVCRDRQDAYGSAEDNFRVIGEFWGTFLRKRTGLGISLTPSDVAAMMVLLKVARAGHHPESHDNWVDMVGYAACGGGIATGVRREMEGILPAPTLNPAAIKAVEAAFSNITP